METFPIGEVRDKIPNKEMSADGCYRWLGFFLLLGFSGKVNYFPENENQY